MPIQQSFINIDEYFNSINSDKIIVNDIEFSSAEGKSNLDYALTTVYNGDTMVMAPSCDCGYLTAGYMLGEVCPVCGHKVTDPYDRSDPIVWLKKFDNMPKFISPHFWLMMKTIMYKNIDCLRWISDPQYNPVNKVPPWLIGMSKTLPDFERSYTYLVNNIETILSYMVNNKSFKQSNKQETVDGFHKLFTENKDKIFSDYLPIIHKRFVVVDHTSKGKYTDVSMSDLMDIVLTYTLTANNSHATFNKKSSVTGRVISMLSDLYSYIFKNNMGGKYGMFRKHIYGSRVHFTFRAVVTSISGMHRYDEIHVPWSIGVTAYRPHLLNILVKQMGYTYKKASHLLFTSVHNYDEDIEIALNTLIGNSANGKLPVIIQRNPSLLPGSAIKCYIPKFKKDTTDLTISMSNLVVTLGNGDYDGDEYNVVLLLDNNMDELSNRLMPAFSVPSTSTPGEVGGLVTLPKPTIATLANYLKSDSDEAPMVNLDINPVEAS